ncbi:MAG: DUF4012 domain-containing protein [Candidatus Moraniibacteriota bacterium]
MTAQKSLKFWIVFILGAAVFLSMWFLFWEIRHRDLSTLGNISSILPMSDQNKRSFETVAKLGGELMNTNGEEKVFLILFQNNMELRPGGGFIGSFGILKIRDGHITSFAVHDTGNFDGRIPDTVTPPYPMEQTLKIHAWKLRDSNWSPDWKENALQATDFYRMGGGEEKFDGVIGVTTHVLTSFLDITGPVEIPGYPGSYGSDHAILDLEYQVEKGYADQNIPFGERKSVMGLLGTQILATVKTLPLSKQYALMQAVFADLNQKDIQIWFADKDWQDEIMAAGWDGNFSPYADSDFLAVVDANLASWKTDLYINRSIAYTVDLRGEKIQSHLEITYEHSAEKRDFMTKEYQTYLRVYAPHGGWFGNITGEASLPPVYGEYQGTRFVGVLVHVPLGTTHVVSFDYELPGELSENYDLKIQKQAGVNDIPVTVKIIRESGEETKSFLLNSDIILSEVK